MNVPANPRASVPEAPQETRRLAVGDGIEIAADVWGDPAADPVVFLHGGGQTRHAWGDTARHLAERGFHALTLDLRGHGESSWASDGDYRLDAFVRDLREVLATLGRPAAVVGASLGGMTALLAAGEAPQSRVSALVLVDIAARIERQGADRIVSFMLSRPEGFASLDEAADAIAAYQPQRRRPRDPSGLAKNLRLGPDGRWRWHWDPRFLTGVGSPGSGDTPTRLDDAARNLTVPTLLVRGRLSDLLSEEGARHFLDLVPHASFTDVAGAGHMVAGDRNDLFTQAVIDFSPSCARTAVEAEAQPHDAHPRRHGGGSRRRPRDQRARESRRHPYLDRGRRPAPRRRDLLASLKLLVVPLVFVSLSCGTAAMDDIARLGRIGGKVLALYLATTAFAITLALGAALVVRPGVGFNLPDRRHLPGPGDAVPGGHADRPSSPRIRSAPWPKATCCRSSSSRSSSASRSRSPVRRASGCSRPSRT